MRVLFFNEGNFGTHVLGHGQLDRALSAGLVSSPDVQARFVNLAPMGWRGEKIVIPPFQPLAKMKLDFTTLRWHVVQSLRARRDLARELDQWPADVVHLYTPAVALTMARIMRRVPVVLSMDTTVHDWWAMPAWRPPQRRAALTILPSRALERRALQNAALVLARTARIRRSAEREAPRARVIEHHPGIDLERYRPAEHRPRERLRVLFVGGRFKEKGGEDLLAALGERLGRDVDLDLVTPAPVAERPGVRVHRLMPSDPLLLDLQQQADVMCLPTYGDTNPWAILEAMACATPVISTDVGGIADMLDDGRAGVLVPYGDRRSLAQALQALLHDPQQRARLGAAARARCEERYDARRQFALLMEYLREAASPSDDAR